MKAEKIDEKIIANLSLKEFVSASYLAERIECSEKTVRQHIQSLNDMLISHGVQIESKHGQGYGLNVIDKEKFLQIYTNGKINTNFLQNSSADRVDYILSFLLLHWKYVDLMELCEVLNVSESTLLNDIKAAKEILKNYHLTITSQRKKGVIISGKEFDIRVCMSHYLDSSKVLSKNQVAGIQKDKLTISNIILNTFSNHNVTMPEISIESLINHIYISMIRIRSGNIIDQINEDKIQLYSYNSQTVELAKEICSCIENVFNIHFDEAEFDYIMIYMIGQRLNHSNTDANYNIVIPNHILEMVHEIMNFVYKTLNIDFRDNFSAIMNLATHMLPLIIRLRYNIKVENPLLYEIKKNYAFGYTIALQAKIIIEQRENIRLNDDEIAYLALIFEVSLQKKNKKWGRQNAKNIIIVCATGKTSAELLAHQYRRIFNETLNEIHICNVHELHEMNFDNIDYVITTTPIYIHTPVPILETKFILNNDDIDTLRQEFEKEDMSWCYKYYDPRLFFPELEFETKEEVITYMCQQIRKVHEIPDDFMTSIMKREEIGTTDFGEMVAMPHPYDRISKDSFTCICTLKKPMFWGDHEVSIILLISIGNNTDENLEKFYQMTSEFLLSNVKAKKLLRVPTYEMLIKLLIESD